MGKARPGVAHDGGAKDASATDAYVAGRQPAKRWVAHDPAKKLPTPRDTSPRRAPTTTSAQVPPAPPRRPRP